MSTFFLSHSSADNEFVEQFKQKLVEHGYGSIFLDFDPQNGIPAGRDWERELYSNLKNCQALLMMCSQDSMASRWCFAEITHAKALGKHIFPLKIGPCKIDPVLTSHQINDLTYDQEEGYQRLWHGLKLVGIDPSDTYDWDEKRPPYPGLFAFQEADAAVFFGRNPEIQAGLETLRQMQQFGGSRILLILGAMDAYLNCRILRILNTGSGTPPLDCGIPQR